MITDSSHSGEDEKGQVVTAMAEMQSSMREGEIFFILSSRSGTHFSLHLVSRFSFCFHTTQKSFQLSEIANLMVRYVV